MFWKKKHTSIDIVVPDSDSRREAFRFSPVRRDLFDVVFMGKKVKIFDISAGGISFEDQGFEKNNVGMITIDLGNYARLNEPMISLRTRILNIDKNHICHTEFEGISNYQKELLHHFVYELQKDEVRNYKSVDND